jgi:hypothetical protein
MKRTARSTRLSLLAAGFATALAAIPLALAGGAGPPPGDPAAKQAEFAPRPAGPRAKNAAKPLPPGAAEREPPWRTGIIDSGQAPLPGSQFTFENQWQNVSQGHHVNVYVGAETDNPAQGVVAVQQTTLDGAASDAPHVYRPQGVTGPLRIVAEHGAVLVLASPHGAMLLFNVETGEIGPK